MHYTKQRNFCVSLLKKTNKRYYENLNEKSVVDNKLFRKNVKSSLSDKASGENESHLIENNKLVKTDLEPAEILNNLFSNIVLILDILWYLNDQPGVNWIKYSTSKAIL